MGESLNFFQVGAVNVAAAVNQIDISFDLPIKDLVFIKAVSIGAYYSDVPGAFHTAEATAQLITTGPIPGMFQPRNPGTTGGVLESTSYPRFFSGYQWNGSIYVSGNNTYILRARLILPPGAPAVNLWNFSALIGYDKSNDQINLPSQNRTTGWNE